MTNPAQATETDEAVPATAGLPKWLWGMAGLAVIWNLFGLLAFIAQVSIPAEQMVPEDAANREAQLELLKQMPQWVYVCFGAATIGGTVGSILLMLGRRWAIVAFLVSLLGILGQQAYMFFLSNTFEVMGYGNAALPLCVLLIGIWLLYVSYSSDRQGYLR